MKRTHKLTERDLSRIVTRVIKEGLIGKKMTFTSDNSGFNVTVDCTKGVNGAGSITGGMKDLTLPLEGDMYNFFCGA